MLRSHPESPCTPSAGQACTRVTQNRCRSCARARVRRARPGVARAERSVAVRRRVSSGLHLRRVDVQLVSADGACAVSHTKQHIGAIRVGHRERHADPLPPAGERRGYPGVLIRLRPADCADSDQRGLADSAADCAHAHLPRIGRSLSRSRAGRLIAVRPADRRRPQHPPQSVGADPGRRGAALRRSRCATPHEVPERYVRLCAGVADQVRGPLGQLYCLAKLPRPPDEAAGRGGGGLPEVRSQLYVEPCLVRPRAIIWAVKQSILDYEARARPHDEVPSHVVVRSVPHGAPDQIAARDEPYVLLVSSAVLPRPPPRLREPAGRQRIADGDARRPRPGFKRNRDVRAIVEMDGEVVGLDGLVGDADEPVGCRYPVPRVQPVFPRRVEDTAEIAIPGRNGAVVPGMGRPEHVLRVGTVLAHGPVDGVHFVVAHACRAEVEHQRTALEYGALAHGAGRRLAVHGARQPCEGPALLWRVALRIREVRRADRAEAVRDAERASGAVERAQHHDVVRREHLLVGEALKALDPQVCRGSRCRGSEVAREGSHALTDDLAAGKRLLQVRDKRLGMQLIGVDIAEVGCSVVRDGPARRLRGVVLCLQPDAARSTHALGIPWREVQIERRCDGQASCRLGIEQAGAEVLRGCQRDPLAAAFGVRLGEVPFVG